jgi:4-amino-4-deoxy-L-arabinose transferase-like glycosyltransferase
MLPLWEGYDEWAHFSVIRIMAGGGGPLPARSASLPGDVAASLELAPVPYEMRDRPWPSVTQDAFWMLPAEERARRESAFESMPEGWRHEESSGALTAYEGFQPPLYYWIMAPALQLVHGASLPAQVIFLRWLSSLIASLAIPLAFLVGRLVFRDDRLALGCAAVLAVMPEFAIDVARVGNECLAAVLFTLLIWAALRLARDGLSYSSALAAGMALGFGLLAKAYFLTAAPVVAVLYAFAWRRRKGGSGIGPALCGIAAPVLVAGWWYVRNLIAFGTLSGLMEAVATRDAGLATVLAKAAHINWARVIDGILLSHLYFGGWSSLTARAWMYHVFYAAIAAAALGLLLRVRNPALGWAAAFYLLFWAGQFYQAALLALSSGMAVSLGWYTYAVASAEIAMAIAGLRAILPERFRAWVVPGGVTAFAALDLYSVHAIAIPYYTGIVAHKANGGVAGLHWGSLPRFAGVFGRLAVFKGPIAGAPVIAGLWVAYVVATVWIVGFAFLRRREATKNDGLSHKETEAS